MNTKWAARMDEITVEHIITPFIQEDENTQIDKWLKANGNKPLVSQKESIQRAGLSDDPDKTFNEIQGEEEVEAQEQQLLCLTYSRRNSHEKEEGRRKASLLP